MSFYFQNFPTIQYDIYGTGRPVEIVDIFRAVRLRKDIRDNILLYTFYEIEDGERPDTVSMNVYGTPDYYWTFFMVNENLVNVYNDWPLSRQELENKIQKKYAGNVILTDTNIAASFVPGETLQGLASGATAIIREKDVNLGLVKVESITGAFQVGELVRGSTTNDILTLSAVTTFDKAPHHYVDAQGNYVQKNTIGAQRVTNDEYEIELNEQKSRIKVIRPEYISRVADEFFAQINPEAQ
jgi:hypothetical protein